MDLLRSRPVFWAVVALGAAIRAGAVLNRALDPDESQHLHTAWRIASGQVPYRDFWEHHAPLFHYLLAPLVRAVAEGPAVYLIGRSLMVAFAGLAVLLTYRLARRASPEVATITTALLLVSPRFTEVSTELRPDVPALVAWLLALSAVVRWWPSGATRWLWAGGLAQGFALALTTKALYGALGLAGAVLVGLAGRSPERPGLGRSVTLLGSFVLALSTVPGLGLAWLAATGGSGTMRALAQQVIRDNLKFVDFMKAIPVTPDGIGVIVLCVGGVWLVFQRRGTAAVADALHGTLLPAAGIVSVVLLLPTTPAVYRHAWLPVDPVVALYAGLALRALVEAGGGQGARVVLRILLVLALAGAVAGPLGASAVEVLRERTVGDFRIMRQLLAATCPGEPVLDGIALAVFRPAAYRHGVLVTGVREWIARGVMAEEEVEADLRRARPRIAYPDRRLRALIGPVAAFLRRHYVAAPDGLLVAGAEVPVSGSPAGGRTYVELLVPGVYRMLADPGIAVAIDRNPVPRGWVDLTAGRHEVTWTGPPGAIRLLAARCDERRAREVIQRGEDPFPLTAGGGRD